ncbi:MAG: N-6 DNA methylase [Fimbriimonadales bacterium]
MRTPKAPSKITEREVAAQIAEALNQHIQQGGTPFEQATVEHRAGNLYPDITLWVRYPQQAFALWELKAPHLQEDLTKLPHKANTLKARYAVVWNFQQGDLYEVAHGQLQRLKPYPTPLLNTLDEWAIVPKRNAVLSQARAILDDLAQLQRGQSLTPYVPDKFYFIGILEKAIHHLVPVLEARLFERKRVRAVREPIDAWAAQQGYPIGLLDLDTMLARHWAYSLAVRILFYFTVRRYYPSLPDLVPDPSPTRPLAPLLEDAFAKAQSVDWQAVFERSPLDQLGLPDDADPILRELLTDFHRYDFGQLKEDVVGQIMEGLIPQQERHALGQYFTREDLIDLMIGFVADSFDHAHYLDPTCGTGTFLIRLYSRLRWLSGYRLTHRELLERLWGIDIAHFPAELATINLFRQEVRDLSNFPRVVVRDFFQVQPHEVFAFPPLNTATEYRKIEIAIPQFHGIVGNFPYIRQELIERQVPGYKKRIVEAIARQWFWRDPALFVIKDIRAVELDQVRHEPPERQHEWLHQQVQAGKIDLRLSGQADIYAYLFYHSAAFLEEGGRIGIVTSNAWLDVAYGTELKRFFLRYFKIVAIVASWQEPWFEDASINTAFVILERCSDACERERNIVRFVKLKQPLAKLLPQDLALQEAERWRTVDALVRTLETAPLHATAWDPRTGHTTPLQGVHTVETPAARIRLIAQAELERELSAKGETAKWGLYIRAPQVYFDLLREVGDKLVPLSQVAEVRFGIKTGINDFFYLEPLGPGDTPGTLRVKNARGWVGEIEQACLRPVIKSPKEAKGLVIDPDTLQYRLFMPPIDPDSDDPTHELRRRFPLAYAYVQWGETQGTPQGQPWPEVPSVQGRKAWWLLLLREPADFLTMGFVDRRFFVLENPFGILASDVMFEWAVKEAENLGIVMSLLNSSLTYLRLETIGRQNLGDGVLKIIGPELSSLLIPDPNLLQKHILLERYDAIKRRPVLPIAQEAKQKDRQALDAAVLEALGLDPEKYLPQIYQGLVEMVEERLALPKMRQTRRKQAQQVSFEQVKALVRQAVVPHGLKSITAFLPAPAGAMQAVALAGRPERWESMLSEFTLFDSAGAVVGTLQGDEHQVRYLLYAAAPGVYRVEVPADSVVAGQAVARYEAYLRQVAGEMMTHALNATRQHRQAERAVRDILESLGLPPFGVERALGG